MLHKMAESIQKNWKHATLEFAFILIFIQVFQAVFGPENTIVAVIFTIMMSASMVRDMTATPVKHLLLQAATLVMMAASACYANVLSPGVGGVIHLVTIFIIVYAYTYEYSKHMYFPYILSYLFLVYISPVPPEQLPKRLLGMLTGAVCIISYQLIKGRMRVVETAQDVLSAMILDAQTAAEHLCAGEPMDVDLEEVRRNLCKLSRTVYERRKRVLQVSDASFAMVDAGRGMEHLILLMGDLKGSLTGSQIALLRLVLQRLDASLAFVKGEAAQLSAFEKQPFIDCDAPESLDFYRALGYIRDHLLHMTDPERRAQYRGSALSLTMRLRAALDVSVVRVVYALRVSILLTVFAVAIRLLGLPHGKWLMFTLASVSLPYADDVGTKAQKRVAATVIGGLCAVALYAFIPNPTARTIIMMASGYVNFFFSDYVGTYSCATIGALGGAVFMSGFGLTGVGGMFVIRLSYIALGAGIALAVNCAILPFRRRTATRLLLEKYFIITALLTQICKTDNPEQVDPQLYYDLVIQAHLQEDQLSRDAEAGGWEAKVQPILAECRQKIREAHRVHRWGYAALSTE